MDASEIIRDFTARGVRLAPTDHGTISITPRSRLTDADRDLLRNHKDDVLAELQKCEHVNIVNIDSGSLPQPRIVRDPEPKFMEPDAYATAERQSESASARCPFGQGTVTEHPGGGMTIRYLDPDDATLRHSGPMVPVLEKVDGRPVVRGFRPAEPSHRPQRPAPATISCGSCAEFEPGPEPLAVGRCSRTANGMPPVASRGYGCCFPTAPRICSDYKEALT